MMLPRTKITSSSFIINRKYFWILFYKPNRWDCCGCSDYDLYSIFTCHFNTSIHPFKVKNSLVWLNF